MLFLGAGASKALGVGYSSDLSREVNAKLKAEGFGDVLSKINDALKNSNIYSGNEVDIEVSFTILNALSQPNWAVDDLGPFAAYLIGIQKEGVLHLGSLPHLTQDEIARMKHVAQNTIVTLCDKLDIEKAKKTYQELFQNTAGKLADGRSIGTLESTVTTNYDIAIEIYDPRKAWERGFEEDRREFGHVAT